MSTILVSGSANSTNLVLESANATIDDQSTIDHASSTGNPFPNYPFAYRELVGFFV